MTCDVFRFMRTVFCAGLVISCTSAPLPSSTPIFPHHEPYIAGIEVETGTSHDVSPETVSGQVFNDINRDGVKQEDEPGVADVLVSNGRDVVSTNAGGRYLLPVRDDMSVFVIQPSGWRVPTDENWVPQFSYEHKPAGSPKPLRYGGLPPSGPIPSSINFPIISNPNSNNFKCAILGDVQTYTNTEVGYMRDSSVDDIIDRGPGAVDCLVAVGDVLGDDLGLIPRVAELWGTIGAPQWWAHGNHDYDFDADYDEDSADSWRRLYGPNYYAFQMGKVTFIVLDNVVYPCTKEDARMPGREFCVENENKRYNARITDDQIAFTQGVIDKVDTDHTIVFVHHIPFVSYVDQTTLPHQTDNVSELYAMVEGRKALSLSGHTHTIENLAPNDHFGPWSEAVNIDALPFRHIVAGAVSGGWYNGDLDVHGTPASLGRLGAPRGWVELDFDPTGDYRERFVASNMGRHRAMWLSVNTPDFRDWYDAIMAWRAQPAETRNPVPPVNLYDLNDVKILTQDDLDKGSYFTANIWIGDSQTKVSISIDDGPKKSMIRTQQARGESAHIGAEFADPFAIQRQFTVGRYAFQSRSGKPNTQGYRPYLERSYINGENIPKPAQPQWPVADRNVHLWRARVPANLAEGVHVATVTVTDRHGHLMIDRMVFEVRNKRPDPNWRKKAWDAFENGAPIRE